MGLREYQKKRDFKKTKEPAGKKKAPRQKGLVFVVQKHNASHLHYDFRLEMGGVLKSWAVPKGPSLNPSEKRLAMHVEDHPYDYKDFEGTIPAGEYGAGDVIVWDSGQYLPIPQEGEEKLAPEKILLRQYTKGDLKIALLGKKLKGAFALVQTSREDKTGTRRQWLLIKKKDAYTSKKSITKNDRSVLSRTRLKDKGRIRSL